MDKDAHMDVDVDMGWGVKLILSSEYPNPFQGRTSQMHLMFEIYHKDFKLFQYDFDNPGNKMPIGEIDLDEVHAKLGE